MPIKSYKLKGSLTLGTTPLDVSCQVTSVSVNPTENVDTEDAIHVLCGEVLPASDTVDYSYTLSGTVLQDLSTGGVVDYTWDNAGQEVPFEFVPDDTAADMNDQDWERMEQLLRKYVWEQQIWVTQPGTGEDVPKAARQLLRELWQKVTKAT